MVKRFGLLLATVAKASTLSHILYILYVVCMTQQFKNGRTMVVNVIRQLKFITRVDLTFGGETSPRSFVTCKPV